MENHLIQAEDKLFLFMKHAATGIIETDINGNIINLNLQAEAILTSFFPGQNIQTTCLFDILSSISAESAEKVKKYIRSTLSEEQSAFLFSAETANNEIHFNLLVNKLSPDCIIISIESLTDKYVSEKILHQALINKAVVQGKYEIASNVLHDIGNAVVGFSSYLTRIKHSLEQDNAENLQNLVGFFETQQTLIANAIGEAKAGAVIKILSGIAQTQKSNQADISKSITEQQHIITHIQEILNIQREYVSGNGKHENRSTHLGSIVKDCMSMLFASLNKRNIVVSQNIPEELPVVKGDRTQLMQVILNILKNSIEAIDFYAVDKNISIYRVVRHADFLLLQIQDSGKGFDEEIGRKLFTRGFTTKSSGSGLGLDHCRAILESNGSTIDIKSEGNGKGAITTLKFKI